MANLEDRAKSVTYCPRCGERFFVALPGHTSKDEIVAFASTAKICEGSAIAEEQWIHPGRYCPNGCVQELWNLGCGDLWEKLERDRSERETASILVRLATPDTTTFDTIKLYLDRNVRRTAPRDKAPYNCEYIEMAPGSHTLIARDYDHREPDRRESNLIEFRIAENECLIFSIADENGALTLTQGEQFGAGQPATPSELK